MRWIIIIGVLVILLFGCGRYIETDAEPDDMLDADYTQDAATGNQNEPLQETGQAPAESDATDGADIEQSLDQLDNIQPEDVEITATEDLDEDLTVDLGEDVI